MDKAQLEEFSENFRKISKKTEQFSKDFWREPNEWSDEEVNKFNNDVTDIRELLSDMEYQSKKFVRNNRTRTFCDNCNAVEDYELKTRTATRSYLLTPVTIEEPYAECKTCGSDVYHEESGNKTLELLQETYKRQVFGPWRSK